LCVHDDAMQAGTIAPRRVVVSIPTSARYLRVARHGARAALASSGVPAGFAADVSLVVGELSTNAMTHGSPGRVWVVITTASSGTVSVRVTHPVGLGDLPPVAMWSTPPPDAPAGRGLGIVRALSSYLDAGIDDRRVFVESHVDPAHV
jgi:anti-sigma regulatory factor (Ser/Thr protein kinase)